jgi:hypothetical protein
LNGYGVYSGTVNPPGVASAKGYKLAQFSDLFDRYLAAPPRNPVFEPSNRLDDCGTGTSDEIRTVEANTVDGSKNGNLSQQLFLI